MNRHVGLLVIAVLVSFSSTFVFGATVLGTGSGALLGGDLTDPENDINDNVAGNPPYYGSGYNWISASASHENWFSPGGPNGAGLSNEAALDVFDNKVGGGSDKWYGVPLGSWVAVQLDQAYRLTHFTVASANDVPNRDPDIWSIEGSNDGATWTPIFSYNNDGTSPWGTTRLQVIRWDGDGADFAKPAPYSWFRYKVDSIVSGGDPQISEIELFGYASAGSLVSTASGNWNASGTWTPNTVPTALHEIEMDGETVTVATPGAGGSLLMTGGALQLNSSLTLSRDITAAAGAVTFNTGGSLSAGTGGVIASASLTDSAAINAGGPLSIGTLGVAGGKTLSTSGAGQIMVGLANTTGSSTYNVAGAPLILDRILDGATAGTLLKTGAGALVINSSNASNTSATTLRVQEGVLRGMGSTLGGSTSLVLAGGLTQLAGPITTNRIDALDERWYTGDSDAMIDPTSSSWSGLQAPFSTFNLTGGLYYPGDNNDQAFFDRMGRRDNFTGGWFGRINIAAGTALPPGVITFGTSSDDGSCIYVDLNQNGQFEASERIVNNGGYHGVQAGVGSVNLAEGTYAVYVGMFEGGGGAYIDARVGAGTITDFNSLTRINPSAQSGTWDASVYGSMNDPALAVTAVANSRLQLMPGSSASVGALTVNAGVTLGVEGSPLTFAGTTLLGGAQVSVLGQSTFGPTVLGDGAAVRVQGGSATLGATTLTGAGAVLDSAAALSASQLTLNNQQIELAGAGSIQIAALNLAGGTNTVNTSGAGRYAIDAASGTGTTMVKAGSGQLSLGGGGGGAATFRVDAGTLRASGASPFGAGNVVLNGGVLEAVGNETYALGIRGNTFAGTADTAVPMDLSGGQYMIDNNRVFAGDKAGTILTMTAGATSILTGQITGWDGFTGYAGGDHFVTALSGRFTPSSTGGYRFRWSNDDRGWMFIDLNDDGVFGAGEAVGAWAWDSNGTVSLAAGQGYNFMYMAQEHGGGESNNFWVTPPGMAEVRVNPSAGDQGGTWEYGTLGAANWSGNAVSVTASSELRSRATLATFGNLSLSSGVTLTTTLGPVQFGPAHLGTGSTLLAQAESTSLGATTLDTQATLNSAAQLNVASLALDAGKQINLAGAGNTTIGVLARSGGNATINSTATGLAKVDRIDDGGTAGTTLTKTGAGVLGLDLGSNANAATTLVVQEGTLLAKGANALGGAAQVTLSGGTLDLVGPLSGTDGVRGSFFRNVAQNDNALNLDGAAYQVSTTRVLTGAKAGSLLALGEDPAMNIVYAGEINGFGMFPGYASTDSFATGWSGTFVPQVSGSYNFRWSNDDFGQMYMDLNHDGVFQDSEGLIANRAWNGNGTVALQAGQAYNFMYMTQEHGGGESNNFWFTAPGAGEVYVNPTVQTGLWQLDPAGAISQTSTNVLVTANSEIHTNANPGASLGALTLNGGTQLTTSGMPIAFTSTSLGTGSTLNANAVLTSLSGTTLAGNATITGAGAVHATSLALDAGEQITLAGSGAVTLDTLRTAGSSTINTTGTGDFRTPALNDQNIAGTLTKTGAGRFTLDNDLGGSSASRTSLVVQAGTFAGVGAAPLGGMPDVTLSGGWLELTGASGWAPGLAFGRVASGSVDLDSANPATESQLGPHIALTQNGADWPDGYTNIYTGQIYLDAAKSYHFIESIDDSTYLRVAGNLLIADDNWNNTIGSPVVTVGASGWYDFDLRMRDGGGGQGYVQINPGFQYNDTGVNTTADADHWYPQDPGNMTLLRRQSVQAIDFRSTPITVTADSGLRAISEFGATFGSVTLNNGTRLTTEGAAMTIEQLALAGPAGRQGTLANANTVTVTGFNDAGVAGTLVKDGTGLLKVDNNAGGIVSGATTFEVRQGILAAQGANLFGASSNITLAGGTLRVEGAETVTANQLNHYGYHIQPDALMDLNNNGGIMAIKPYGAAILTDGPGGRGLNFDNDADFTATGAIGQNDNYMNLFTGYLNVTTAGMYTFRNAGDDDRGGIWLDLDRNGNFESSTAGLGSNRGEQLSWEDGGTKSVFLQPGRYLFAATHGEYGGGSAIDIRFQGPGMASEEAIQPTSVNQAGLWSSRSLGGIDMTGKSLLVTANSALEAYSNTSPAAFGALTLNNGTTLTTRGNTDMTFGPVQIAGPAGRTGRINNDNQITIDQYSDGGVASRFIKGNAGTMVLDTSGATVQAGATTWEVAGGTMVTAGLNPLGSSTNVVLSGGTLDVTGESTMLYNALRGSIFTGIGNDGGTAVNFDGAAYQASPSRVLVGDKAGTILTRTEDAGRNVLATTRANNWENWAGVFDGNADNMITAFSGTFTPAVSGSYNFYWSNDDAGSMFIDLNNNGTFDAGERVGSYAWTSEGNVSLTAGQAYNVIFTAHEYGGGQSVNWNFTPPGGSRVQVNPGDPGQAGLWSTLGTQAVDFSAVSMSVTANSGFRTASDGMTTVGSLSVAGGTTLTTTGTAMTFNNSTVPGPAGSKGTISNSNTVNLNGFSDGGLAVTLAKTGTGTMYIGNDVPGNINTSGGGDLRVEQGVMRARGFGGMNVTIGGGEFQIQGAAGSGPGNNLINYAFYNASDINNLPNIDDNVANGLNGGLFNLTPASTSAWTGQLYLGDQGSNYTTMWTGKFTAPVTGTYDFYTHGDDHEILYIDTNGNGEFETAAGERVTSNLPPQGWDTPQTGSVYLVAGQSYDFAAAGLEWGGGAWFEASIRVPGGNLIRINPDDPAQKGWWSGTGTILPINATDINIKADGTGTLNAITHSTANFGVLTLKSGTLTATGARGGFTFTGGAVDPAATSVTLNVSQPTTIGPWNGNNANAEIVLPGTGAVTLTGGTTNNGGVSFSTYQAPLTINGPAQAANLLMSGSGNIHTGLNDVLLSSGGKLQSPQLTVSTSGAPLSLGGDNLASGPARMGISGGTVTVRQGASMPAGLQLWLDASTLGLNDGDNLTTWADNSGKGHNADGRVSDPSYVAFSTHGRPAVYFDGDDELNTSFNFDSDQYTILSVARYTSSGDSDGNSRRVIDSATRNWLFGFHGALDERFYAEGWISTTGSDNTNWHIHAGTMTNDADPLANFWKEGNLLVANSTGSSNTNYRIGRLRLGGSGGENSRAEISEILIFDHVLSAAEMNNVGGYLAAKYALPTSYTGNFDPQNVYLPTTNINVSGSATLHADTLGSALFGDLDVSPSVALSLTGANLGGFSVGKLTAGQNATISGNLTARDGVDPDQRLGILGNFTLANGGVYEWVMGGEMYETIDVSGLLTLNDWTIRITDILQLPRADDKYYLFTGFYALSGVNNWTLEMDLPVADWDTTLARLGIDQTGLFLTGVTVPEPATMGLLLAAVAGLGGYVRRRRRA